MEKLTDIPADELREALEAASSAKAAKRIMVALAYKDGVSVDTLSERYAIPRSTVYSWLDRFEKKPIKDDDRSGRPPALTAEEREELKADLACSFQMFGFEVA